MKTCRLCKVTLPLAAFGRLRSRRDGLRSECRTCHCTAVKADRAAHPEKHAARDKARYIGERREKMDAAARRRKQDRLKGNAHAAVERAVKRGDLVRPSACPRCSRAGRVMAHHEDYRKPLDVDWMCGRCHARLHRGAA